LGLYDGLKFKKGHYKLKEEALDLTVWRELALEEAMYLYRVAHEKPARRPVEKRGRISRTLYRKLNKCKCKALTG
jgi:hypothetical protein